MRVILMTLDVEVDVPKVPNFVSVSDTANKTGEPRQMISISKLSDESLRQLGAAWTDALVYRAKQIREQKS